MYTSETPTIIAIMLLAYTLGSVPFGVLLSKAFRLPDPRAIGSGNIGATNMLRTGRRDVAALTLLLDAGKGAAAVLLTSRLFGMDYKAVGCVSIGADPCPSGWYINPILMALALLFAATGHMVSPWLKFKGGKGMATILGAALAFSWPAGMAMCAVWLLVCFTTRYVSLASISALATLPLVVWLRIDGTTALICAMASAIAIWRHRGNIKRLRAGFEPKINLAKGQK